MTAPNIVSGAVSTVAELGKDDTFLQDWLREQPGRLGLGDMGVADAEPVQDDEGNPAFLASGDDDRYFSVDVRLGEIDASHGFQLLDNWARNRVRHPDKTHVAVLVTETIGDRYRTTLKTLAEHLPLVVVELRVWRGETEAIVVPHIALASDDIDLHSAPAAKAAQLMVTDEPEGAAMPGPDEAEATDDAEAGATGEAEAGEAGEPDQRTPEDKDDTGVSDPWGLPQDEPGGVTASGNGSTGLLDKVGS